MVDDRSSIIVDFWVPERYAGAVKVGEPLTATPIAGRTKSSRARSARSTTGSTRQSRTLLVQARIANADDSLRAGMSFQVAMSFAGDTYPSVNPLAIQWGSRRRLRLDGAQWQGQARAGAHHPAQHRERAGRCADLASATMVVTEGVHIVREGAELLIAGAEPTGSGERNGTPAAAPRSGSKGERDERSHQRGQRQRA